jgi:hypothetical protein
MRKFLFICILLSAALTACGQKNTTTAEKDIEKDVIDVAYKFEHAYMQRDYKEEQKYIYAPGSFEVHKDVKVEKGSNLKYEDVRFEVYHLEDKKRYVVFMTYENPHPDRGNTIHQQYVIRQKDGTYKIDTDESLYIEKSQIEEKYKMSACVNCE